MSLSKTKNSIYDKTEQSVSTLILMALHKSSFSPVHTDLPVGLSCHIDIVQVSSVVLGICPSQSQLSSYSCFWVSKRQNRHKENCPS